jgi:ATP-binding cassette subfamily B multidrug efflux pump
MDELIVLDNARIIERGSHDALLSQGGVYAMLWSHQSGGFLQPVTDLQRAKAVSG